MNQFSFCSQKAETLRRFERNQRILNSEFGFFWRNKVVGRPTFRNERVSLAAFRDDLIVKCGEMSLVLDPQLPNGLSARWPLTPQPTSGDYGGRDGDGGWGGQLGAASGLLSSSMMNFSRCYSPQESSLFRKNLRRIKRMS